MTMTPKSESTTAGSCRRRHRHRRVIEVQGVKGARIVYRVFSVSETRKEEGCPCACTAGGEAGEGDGKGRE